MMFFSANGTTEGLQGAQYPGELRIEDVDRFLAMFVPQKQERKKAKAKEAPVDTGPMKELTAENPLKDACGTGICAVVMLDGMQDESTLQQQKDLAEEVRKSRAGTPFKFVYM